MLQSLGLSRGGASRVSSGSPKTGDSLSDPLAGSSLEEAASTLEDQLACTPKEVAMEGAGGPGGRLPFRDAIQASFGPEHDVEDIVAHTGPEASASARRLDAKGYATGSDVAFDGAPDLHTAAHEAAHVMQQRGGVQLKAVGGGAGDVFERHADAVADRVVAGEPAGDLLGGGAAKASGVQRKAMSAIRQTLIDSSDHRKSNGSYNGLLATLNTLATDEPKAITSEQIESLRERVLQVIPTVDDARSKSGWSATNATRVARNEALEQLKRELQEKADELQAMIEADEAEDAAEYEIKGGPKAGFEMEYCDVMVFDVNKLSDFQRRKIVSGDGLDQSFWKGVQRVAGYGKRDVIFTSAGGTWEGQTDSTVSCSNLELVTKPISDEDWLEEGGTAETDAGILTAFTTALNGAPRKKPLLPKQLEGDVTLNAAGARLYKMDLGATPQLQMTAAMSTGDGDHAPDWWLDGLHRTAMPSMKVVVNGLKATSLNGQKNPKSGAFYKDRKNVLIKTPISKLLGRPTDAPGDEAKETWLQGMAAELGVALGDNAVKKLVDTTKNANPNNRSFWLQEGNFTWRQYLEGLLNGTDLVTTWAATAFGGTEDAGIGQIDDQSLDHQWVVEEHRETVGYNSRNFLAKARDWAQNKRVPQ